MGNTPNNEVNQNTNTIKIFNANITNRHWVKNERYNF
jgi:hypothetical protein